MTTTEKILTGLLIGAAGGGFLYAANEKGWIKLPGKKGGGGDGAAPGGWQELPGTDNAGASKGDPIGPGGAVPASKALFPLGRGSKGKEVSALQKALGIKIDGDFGKKTEDALFKKFGFKEVSANGWAEITGQTAPASNGGTRAADAWETGKAPETVLRNGLENKSFERALVGLSMIPDVAAYTAANAKFKAAIAPNSFVKKTIITAVFDAWPVNSANAEKRAALEKEFLRMGLKKTASGQWSLSGLAGLADMLSM